MARTLLDLTCSHCGIGYQRPKGGTGQKYCSQACAKAALRKPADVPSRRNASVTVVCAVCGTQFHPILGRAKTHRFCSWSCRDVASRKPIREMSETEVAWLAGLFDGEGHIAVRARLNRSVFGVEIQITNTCRALVDQVRAITGVGYITTRYHDDPKHKPTHDWHTTGGNAIALVRLMSPWLLAKRERADQVLAL